MRNIFYHMLMEFFKKKKRSANLNGKTKYQRICKSENCEKYLYISIKKFLNENWDEQKHTFNHVLDKNKCISNQGEDVIEKTISIFRYVCWRVLNSTSYKYGVFFFYFSWILLTTTLFPKIRRCLCKYYLSDRHNLCVL